MSRLDDIQSHWPVFELYAKNKYHCNVMPEGAVLIDCWLDYCTDYTRVNTIDLDTEGMPDD
jgi:hypothetical protein